jgi:predicted ATPase
MAITSLKVSNFKNINKLDIKLNPFNILLGPNASGKSNVISIFKFLRDMACLGLENAISMQGGIEYLRNINLGSSSELSIRVVCEPGYVYNSIKRFKGKKLRVKVVETTYDFALGFHKTKLGYSILRDEIQRKVHFYFHNKKTGEIEKAGEGVANVLKKASRVITEFNCDQLRHHIKEERKSISAEQLFFNYGFSRFGYPIKEALIGLPVSCVAPYEVPFEDISVYDIDPRLSKRAVPITSKITLEEDGANLAIILNNLLKDKKQEARFNSLLKDFLPFIEGARIERLTDKSMIFGFKEKYFSGKFLPASIVSDGTINIVSLICALYFEKTLRSEPLSLKIFEEPERNIHPSLVSKVINMMKDVSKLTQILVTTHNPEFVKHADIENILLISRGEDGYSSIFRPLDNQVIRTFLEDEIGIDELFAQNLLVNN